MASSSTAQHNGAVRTIKWAPSAACMHDRTTRLDEHKITAAAGLNLPSTEPELQRAPCNLHARDDEHKITATLVFKNPDSLFTAMNVPTNTGFQCSCQGWFTIKKGSVFFSCFFFTQTIGEILIPATEL